MSVLFVLIPLSIAIAASFLAAFLWAVRSGQYDDTCTPAMRMLHNDRVSKPAKIPGLAGSPRGSDTGA